MIIKIDTEKETVEMHSQRSDHYKDEIDFIGSMATFLALAVSTFPSKYFDDIGQKHRFVDVVSTIAKQMINEEIISPDEPDKYNKEVFHLFDDEDSDDKYKEI
jgi:hypothetical protein